MRRIPGNELELGIVDSKGAPLKMTPQMRSTHLYICGSTGTGKSKMLESLVRQDIKQWHKSKCGALIIDPHGSLYNSLISWIAWNEKYLKDVPLVPIDLREKDWTIGYNVMRPRDVADPAVVVSNFVQAMAYVWGADGTQNTPLFGRLAKEVLWPVYEKKMTLHEVKYLIDRVNKRLRTELTEGLSNQSVASGWEFSNLLSPKDFNVQFSSTVNRFYNFLDTEKLQLMFGQNEASLDLGKAIEEGQIVIANLSTQGGRISKDDASLFGALLLSDLWTAASERGKGIEEGDVRPFYVYVDEFQNFITPTIAENLDQARGFGLHLTLANQFPRQILHAGANGAQVYDSVMANARSKIVFSLEGEENLKPLVHSLFLGVINPDAIKLKLYSRKIMDYLEEERIIESTSDTWSDAEGDFTGATDTDSLAGAIRDGQEQEARIWNRSGALSSGTSRIRARAGGSSESKVPFLRPIFGEELSSVQYRTIEEQVFMAMQTLADQQQRHGVARLVGMRAPLNIVTPTVERKPTSKEMADSFLTRAYQKLPFALRSAEAQKQIEARQQKIIRGSHATVTEPVAVRRRLK
jgi:hypothetical protein